MLRGPQTVGEIPGAPAACMSSPPSGKSSPPCRPWPPGHRNRWPSVCHGSRVSRSPATPTCCRRPREIAAPEVTAGAGAAAPVSGGAAAPDSDASAARLEQEIESLRREVAGLKAQFAAFKQQLENRFRIAHARLNHRGRRTREFNRADWNRLWTRLDRLGAAWHRSSVVELQRPGSDRVPLCLCVLVVQKPAGLGARAKLDLEAQSASANRAERAEPSDPGVAEAAGAAGGRLQHLDCDGRAHLDPVTPIWATRSPRLNVNGSRPWFMRITPTSPR